MVEFIPENSSHGADQFLLPNVLVIHLNRVQYDDVGRPTGKSDYSKSQSSWFELVSAPGNALNRSLLIPGRLVIVMLVRQTRKMMTMKVVLVCRWWW